MAALDIVGAVLLLACMLLLALVARRRLLTRNGGTIEMSVRQAAGHWMFGLARFEADRLLWFRTFSLSPRPRREFSRTSLHVNARRAPRGAESLSMAGDAVVLECADDGRRLDIAVAASGSLGLMAWLEAGQRASSATSRQARARS